MPAAQADWAVTAEEELAVVRPPLVLFDGSDSGEPQCAARPTCADDYGAKPMKPSRIEERVIGSATASSAPTEAGLVVAAVPAVLP